MKVKEYIKVRMCSKSSEHEVSLQSAKNIMEAINHDKYDVTLIGIDKKGNWHLNNNTYYLVNERDPKLS